MPGLIYTPQLTSGHREPRKGKGVTTLSLASSMLSKTSSTRPSVGLGNLWILLPRLLPSQPLTDFMTGTTFRIDGGSTPTL